MVIGMHERQQQRGWRPLNGSLPGAIMHVSVFVQEAPYV
jgi:hypothetical protein